MRKTCVILPFSRLNFFFFTLKHSLFALTMKAGFVLITVFEVLLPLCLFHRRFRWIGLAIMTPVGMFSVWTKVAGCAKLARTI
jgi:hypothetical protein